MRNLLDRILGRDRSSASQAKERLQLVLIHDRTDLAPGTMDALKDEIIGVISKYVDIDPSLVTIEMTQDGREQRLVADIPITAKERRRVR